LVFAFQLKLVSWPLRAMALIITTFSITIKNATLNITIKKRNTQHNNTVGLSVSNKVMMLKIVLLSVVVPAFARYDLVSSVG
jgi:hypothetical protein